MEETEMSDDKTTGGASGQQDGGATADDNKKKDVVAYETYSKTVDEVKSLKAKLREIEERDKTESEKKLREQNEWKALAEAKEKQLAELNSKHTELESSIVESIKLNAFQKHLGGKLRSDDYFNFVDTDKIVYNPETKKVDVESVKGVVADFVKTHSVLVDFGKKGTLPNRAAAGMSGGASGKSLETMSREELEAHILEMAKRGAIK